jgi:hypothetical protein
MEYRRAEVRTLGVSNIRYGFDRGAQSIAGVQGDGDKERQAMNL